MLTVSVSGAGWLHLACVSDELLELLDADKFLVDDLLGVLVDAVVGVELLLQLDDRLVTLVQPRGQGDHDVSLLKKQLLVPVDLGFLFFYLSPLTFHLLQLQLIFLPDQLLLLFKQ